MPIFRIQCVHNATPPAKGVMHRTIYLISSIARSLEQGIDCGIGQSQALFAIAGYLAGTPVKGVLEHTGNLVSRVTSLAEGAGNLIGTQAIDGGESAGNLIGGIARAFER